MQRSYGGFSCGYGFRFPPPSCFDPFADVEQLVAAILAGDAVITIAGVVVHSWAPHSG
jgi:hypothetical protein